MSDGSVITIRHEVRLSPETLAALGALVRSVVAAIEGVRYAEVVVPGDSGIDALGPKYPDGSRERDLVFAEAAKASDAATPSARRKVHKWTSADHALILAPKSATRTMRMVAAEIGHGVTVKDCYNRQTFLRKVAAAQAVGRPIRLAPRMVAVAPNPAPAPAPAPVSARAVPLSRDGAVSFAQLQEQEARAADSLATIDWEQAQKWAQQNGLPTIRPASAMAASINVLRRKLDLPPWHIVTPRKVMEPLPDPQVGGNFGQQPQQRF